MSRRARRENGEDDSLSSIAREAEARLAAKRAARAEAREIRLKELEKQQREVNIYIIIAITMAIFYRKIGTTVESPGSPRFSFISSANGIYALCVFLLETLFLT